MTREAVTNSTCLIGLERIGRLDLLPQVFSTVFAPPTVAAEVRTPSSWLMVQPVQNVAAVATLKTQMDVGEAEAIALAMELGDVLLILDDKKARRVAQQLGLKVIGTVGMLLATAAISAITLPIGHFFQGDMTTAITRLKNKEKLINEYPNNIH